MAEKYYRGKQGLDCYLKLMEANDYNSRWNIEDNNLARRLTEEVIAMCPENPMGYLHPWMGLPSRLCAGQHKVPPGDA